MQLRRLLLRLICVSASLALTASSVALAQSKSATQPRCPIDGTEGCYWLSNVSGCFEKMAGADVEDCWQLNSCSGGGGGLSGGGCYKWATASNAPASPWPDALLGTNDAQQAPSEEGAPDAQAPSATPTGRAYVNAAGVVYVCAQVNGQHSRNMDDCGEVVTRVGRMPLLVQEMNDVSQSPDNRFRSGEIAWTEATATLAFSSISSCEHTLNGRDQSGSITVAHETAEETRTLTGRTLTAIHDSEQYAKLIRAAADLHDAQLTAHAVRIDLDGNGTEEVLFHAVGAIGGERVLLMGVRALHGADGDVATSFIIRDDPHVSEFAYGGWNAFHGLTDLEGDGTLEVLTSSSHGLQEVTQLWRFTGTGLEEVVGRECHYVACEH